MSHNRPIGIFDSGLGGLTVTKEIHQLLPNESTVYIGDTARVPYGNRSPETVTQFSSKLVQFLIDRQVKAIVVACATASSVALESLQRQFSQIPIIGVIQPTAKTVASSHASDIAILGTRATIQSKSFANAILTTSPQTKIRAIACPLFVPLIEEGITTGPILEKVIDLYLQSLAQNPPTTAILGCTHYPLITDALQHYLPSTQFINVGVSTAHELKTILNTSSLESDNSPVKHEYYATDVTDNFRIIAEQFLQSPLTITSTHLTD